MFHEVKLLDSKGKLKKTISSNELSKRYWSEFHEENQNRVIVGKGKQFRKKSEEEYDDFEYSYFSEN